MREAKVGVKLQLLGSVIASELEKKKNSCLMQEEVTFQKTFP